MFKFFGRFFDKKNYGNDVVSRSQDLRKQLQALQTDVDRSPRALMLESYVYSAVSYSCIDRIAKACSNIKVETAIQNKNGEIEIKPDLEIGKLLKQPNPRDDWRSFIIQFVCNYYLYGNVYQRGLLSFGRKITELLILDSLNMSVIDTNASELFPSEYYYTSHNGQLHRYKINPITGEAVYEDRVGITYQLKHLKTYNPQNPYIGMSPLEPIALSLNLSNKGLRWNHATVDGAGIPAGLLQTETPLSDEQFGTLSENISSNWAGVKKGRSIIVLDNGMKYQQLSLSPVDMDYIQQLDKVAEYIAVSLGVPPVLINPDNSAYNNQLQAIEDFYENTVIPLLELILNSVNAFLAKSYPNQILIANLDSISGLESKRSAKFDRMIKARQAKIITTNEARQEIGFDPSDDPEADELYDVASMNNQANSNLAEMEALLNEKAKAKRN